MISKRWFRFGLPLGSATIVAALLDNTIGLYWLLNDVGSSLFFHWWDHSKPIDKTSVINLALISTRFGLALSLWIFVLFKQRLILIFWLPLSVITDTAFIINATLNRPQDSVQDELWVATIFSLFLFRFYINSVMFQTLIRLLRNARLKIQPVITISNEDPCPGDGLEEPESVKYFLVEPIGRNPLRIWRYYDHLPRLGAAVLVSFELAWTWFALSTHLLTEYLLGGHLFFLHEEEEIHMRVWRIFISFIALLFILKRRKTLLRFWLIIYFWTLFISVALTIWTIIEWTFETPTVICLVVSLIAVADIILRFSCLYFCLMFSLQASLNVSRTQSLKSEAVSLQHWKKSRKIHPKNKLTLAEVEQAILSSSG